MNDRVQQQTLHVDENMSFLAFDQLARIEPVRINAGPPVSALFTLWLSMMQAVGLASRSQHEADGSEFEESESAAIEVLPILGQSADSDASSRSISILAGVI